jgi:CRISPR-associated exonuclease Cas4
MKIKSIKIHNWRSIRDTEIFLNDLLILIGQNNHGKSNIISALLFFFGEIKCEELDFHKNTDELFVEVTFENLDKYDLTTFQKYVTVDRCMRVRKVATKNGVVSYHGYVEMPNEEWLKEDNAGNYTSREQVKDLPLNQYLPASGRLSKANIIEAQQQYIQENRDKISFTYALETTNFLGTKNVAKGIFGDVYFVPSIKEASSELSLKGNSVFNQLYTMVIQKMSDSNDEFKALKDKFKALIKSLNKLDEDGNINQTRPTELKELEEALESELLAWNTTIDVEIEPPNIEDVFKIGTNIWIDDGIRTDISRKGDGLQRALIFALIRSLAKISNLKENSEEDITEDKKNRQSSKSSFFILEEPELCLHPQAQRQLFDSLVVLSNSGNQVIICTHSSSFLSLEYYKSICIVKRDNLREGTYCLQCKDDLFHDATDKEIFNLIYWLNPDRSELFFANKVILVEGQTDKTIIPLLASKLGFFKHEYTLIDCGSKDNMKYYIKLLNKFSIPYIVVYDKDHQAYKDINARNCADNSSKIIEEHIDKSIGKSIQFINDIEEELGIMDKNDKNKPYKALQKVSEEGYIIPESLKKKIEEIYE